MYNNFYTDEPSETYNPLKAQFDTAMQREQKTITKYYDKTGISVLFRRNEDKNGTQNRTTIYYYANSDLQQGQLIKYKNDTYIVLNQETAENEVYLKSDLLKTNTAISTISNGIELYIPCYNGDLLGALPDENKVITTLSGYSELITEDCPTVHNLQNGATFDSLGHTFKVVNYVYKDGLAYFYVEQTQSTPKEYTITIDAPSSTTFAVGSTAMFTATCKFGGDTVINASLKWSSSNLTVATINDSGQAMFLSEGSVTFAVLWTEHNKTNSILITVSQPIAPSNYTATISGSATLKSGGSARKYTATFTDNDGTAVVLTPKWELECLPENEKYFTVTYTTTDSCSIAAADNVALVGTQIKLILSDVDDLCRADKTIDIISYFS